MAVMYAQNGVVVRQTESINWFADSPDFTMESLYVPITYGTVTIPTNPPYNGAFKTCPMDLASANEVEFNVKYRILGWNRDAQSYVGQFYTGDFAYRHGVDFIIESASNDVLISYFANGINDNRVMLYEGTAFTFSIQDDIEFKYIANKLNTSVYVRLKQNGTTLIDTTFTNIDGLTFSNNNSFNFFGVRASIGDTTYSAPAMLYLDSTNFKADGAVVWGSTKV